MPTIPDYASLYCIFEIFWSKRQFFGQNDSLDGQAPKKNLYQAKKLLNFNLLNPHTIST